MTKISTAFDQAATTYDASSQLQQQVARHLVEQVGGEDPETILDIGCGTGLVAGLAAQRWTQAQITGLDAAPAMLREAQKKLPKLQVIQGDASRIHLTSKFDLIFSNMVLHWLPNPREVLLHWQSLLKPDGRLFVALPVQGTLHEWSQLCQGAGFQDGLWEFPKSDFAEETSFATVLRDYKIIHPTLHAFLKTLKKTGASTSRFGEMKLPPTILRRLICENAKPFEVTTRVLYVGR